MQRVGKLIKRKGFRVHGGGRTYFLNFCPTRRSTVPQVYPQGSIAQSRQQSNQKWVTSQTSFKMSPFLPRLKCPLGGMGRVWRATHPSRASPLPSQLSTTPFLGITSE